MTTDRLTRSSAPRPGVGIVHLGLGAFARAFVVDYVADAMRASGGDWGIVGVSLQSATIRDALRPQGFAYTSVTMGPEGETTRVIETVQDILVAREDPQAVLSRMADPAVRIVSLTVTEKGYCYTPATGALDTQHPDILHDIAQALPVSAPGYIVRALQMRHAAGHRPFTVLSCDNLPSNGALARNIVLALARAIDPDLAELIAAEARFPATMVDRITPATSPDDIARIAAATGRHDAAPVLHEPFRQWVVEDRFVDDARPDLGTAGVELVEDVEPFEDMKLRMLNGTHSTLAYLGYLAGHETIADTVSDPVFATFLQGLWRHEIIPAVAPPPGVSLTDYADALLARYANPAIRHRTWQIAMDGSQKLPQRILGTLAEGLDAGRHCPGLCLGVAAWMRYVGGVDEAGQPIDVRDPLAARLRAASDGATGHADKVRALLATDQIFAPALAARLAAPVTEAYVRLADLGARGAIQALNGATS